MPPLSPFAPKTFPLIAHIRGLSMTTASLQGRYHPRDNLLIAHFPNTTTLAGVTTLSSLVGAPVIRARDIIKNGRIQGLIVNAGNANVCTGLTGIHNTKALCSSLAKTLHCHEDLVLMASTGIIGEQLDPLPFLSAFDNLSFPSSPSWEKAANAIMTTDTYPKGKSLSFELHDNTYALSGIAKGSGMVAPHMATLLSFLFTDITLPAHRLQNLLNEALKTSFNAITIDGDTSTSDMVLLIATGQSPPLTPSQEDTFAHHLQNLCHNLALQIVKDGEGVSKIMTVSVHNARTKEDAKTFANSIASSPLVKTAIHGEDLNWGRIAMALGKTLLPLDPERITISIGNKPLYKKGKECREHIPFCEDHIKKDHVSLSVDLALGTEEAFVYASDLTHGYIDINAHYRS